MPHTIEIVNNLLVVLDEDGNGCDACRLRSLREAKRQLRCWQDEYTFDYAEALRAVSEFFAARPGPLSNGTHVRVDIAQGAARCEGVIREAVYDDGWLYHIEVTAGDECAAHRNDAGQLWVCEFEVSPL